MTTPADAIRITSPARALPLVFALGLMAASAAGVALGLVAVVAVERMRGLLGEVEWGDDGE